MFAKAEFLNPGGSIKDRTALQIIIDAKSDGRLASGELVVEMTSGNTGAGLAVVCAALGHPFVAVMTKGVNPASARQIEAMGAEVTLVNQVDGCPGRITGSDLDAALLAAREIALKRNGFLADQFANASGIRAHERTTGPEMLRQMDGRISAFVAGVGTAGAFVGISRFLKSQAPAIQTYAVEPEGCQPLAGGPVNRSQHMLQGIGSGRIPPLWDPTVATGFLAVSDEEANYCRKVLAAKEGLFVGLSSAANICAAHKLALSGSVEPHGTILTILCDSGLKYVDV